MSTADNKALIGNEDALALSLIMEIVTLGKAGKPHRHLLKPLKSTLAKAPDVKRVLEDTLKNITADSAIPLRRYR